MKPISPPTYRIANADSARFDRRMPPPIRKRRNSPTIASRSPAANPIASQPKRPPAFATTRQPAHNTGSPASNTVTSTPPYTTHGSGLCPRLSKHRQQLAGTSSQSTSGQRQQKHARPRQRR